MFDAFRNLLLKSVMAPSRETLSAAGAKMYATKCAETGISNLSQDSANKRARRLLDENSDFLTSIDEGKKVDPLAVEKLSLPPLASSVFLQYGSVMHGTSGFHFGEEHARRIGCSNWTVIGGDEDASYALVIRESAEQVYLDPALDGCSDEKVLVAPTICHWVILLHVVDDLH